ncbi:oligosaccharide flippase family protein [Limobrevibacterium gyesilva]|uniref:Polysaccharide biosynthesis C-terminal domain-containing protein n=1 Tax=Limobrevibacterium gyesilva TaxID=2991712 RepID=A0AA41YS26_9PROT|nr:polysaccharide biosynthesis C-terminal domain-containing protein [Limobrevibacterium gyesilva]MCW3475480.1 polysaccharide biosynthesis C-terminal domain-containing protein [Limobrevibacterium gyesilva]
MPGDEGRLQRLTAPRTVAIGATWNVLGRALPLLVAVAATPFLIDGLGVTRWGIFTLALSLVGLFGIFDFGFGRAITRLIADRLATGDEAQAACSVVTGIAVLTLLGLLGGGVMAALAHLYVTDLLDLSPALRQEVLIALYVLCASAPLVILNAALWGVLSAFQRFGAANLVITPITALYYLGPLAILPFFDSLIAVMAVLVVCRAVMTVLCWRLCLQAMPSLRQGRIAFAAIRPLLRFGGWITVSNIAFPAALYMDRFVIASSLSAAAAAYYATPFDLILRFSVIPVAVMQTAFPAMTTSYRQAPEAAARLLRISTVAIAACVFPAALLLTAFAEPVLRLWLGAGFALQAAPVLRILGLGVLFMCADMVPQGLLDGIGRPDLNAKLTVAATALYIPALLGLIALLGIEGAALAWTLRVIATYASRLALCARSLPPVAGEVRRLFPPLAVALSPVAVQGSPASPFLIAAVTAACGTLFAACLWTRSLTAAERATLRTRLAHGLRKER